MPATWPPSLQQKLNEEGFSFSIGDTVLRSENSWGPSKTRRTMTKSVDIVRASLTLTTAQYNTFFLFFDTTLNGGVNTFTFNHPVTGVATEFRFSAPPSIVYIGGDYYRASIQWESMP